jgi:hypothetical protein
MRVPAKPEDIIEAYIDESSQNKHRFLVLGVVIFRMTSAQKFNDLIATARLPELPQGEAKWTKVSKAKLAAYKRLVDVLFDNPEEIHFHSLFVDTTQQDHKSYNEGDEEIGFNKEVYQLANKIGRLCPDDYFHLYPDYRDTKNSPEELRLILNRGAAKRGDKRDWPIRRCQFRNSKLTPPLQLTDIITGAIAFQLNGHDKAENANPAKIELAKYIMQRAGIADVTKGTARTGKFTIWPRQLKKK